MINTGRTRDAILDPEDAPPLIDLIKEGDFYKMQTFDQHLFQLVRDDVITLRRGALRLDQPARPHGRAAAGRPRVLTTLAREEPATASVAGSSASPDAICREFLPFGHNAI